MENHGVQLDEYFVTPNFHYSTEDEAASGADGFRIKRVNFYGKALVRTYTVDENMHHSLKVIMNSFFSFCKKWTFAERAEVQSSSRFV